MDLPARAFSSVVRRVLRFQLPSRKSPRTKPTLWSVVESSSACSRFQAETSLTQLVYHTVARRLLRSACNASCR